MSSADFPLPLADDHSEPNENPWALPEIEPTNLIVLWPHDEAPLLEEVIAALSQQCGGPVQVVAQPPPRDERMVWAAVLQLPESSPASRGGVPIIAWAEPMRPMSEENLKFLQAESTKWAIGFETLLLPPDPVADFIHLLRLCGNAFPDSPAILDVNKEGWNTRQDLDDDLLREEIEITESLLWFVHAVGVDSPPNENSKLWLYTQGLHRCGLPELEMLEVPHAQVGSALALLNGVAELVMEEGMPAPGEPFEVGNGLVVTFQPWKEVAAFVDENSPGGINNRIAHNEEPLTGVRAAVCGAQPVGTYRKVWTWPAEAVQRLAQQGETAIYKTKRAARLRQQLARSTWSELVNAFHAMSPAARQEGEHRQAVFLIKAGIAKPKHEVSHPAHDDFDDREHLWFEVIRFHGQRAEARLVNEPVAVPHLHQGTVVQIDRNTVSDWQVLTRRGSFGPTNTAGLQETIVQINGAVS